MNFFIDWFVHVLNIAGVCFLLLMGVWLTVCVISDIKRCERLMFAHIVMLTCAGSALALALLLGVLR